jgi:hypothetical protein
MMAKTLDTFLNDHRMADGPWIVVPSDTNTGGVDPLGLRQINFDLMDRMFPGLNNVARHIRPFTLVSWAWRRTVQLAKGKDLDLKLSVHQDFVARIEVAYLWSMLVDDDGGWQPVDLPGQQRVKSFIGDRKTLRIGDDEWREFVKSRRNSTALTAAINYGPGLSALRCLEDDLLNPGVKVPVRSFLPALDAFERKIQPMLDHPIFNGWGTCTLKRSEVLRWQPLWHLDKPTEAERHAFQERLKGSESGARQAGVKLLVGCASQAADDADDWQDEIRRGMCDSPEIPEAARRWKRTQMRQAFRLALEAMFEWIVKELGSSVLTTEALAKRFLEASGSGRATTADQWLSSLLPNDLCPVNSLRRIEEATGEEGSLERAIVGALAVSLRATEELRDGSTRDDRLPLSSAVADFNQLSEASPIAFLSTVIERWVLAQHTYWSVGRGLADARAGAKTILRLRVVLEEGGWRVTRGRGSRGMPRPTPDRLATALSLATEAGLV